jgi:hypothetical protein
MVMQKHHNITLYVNYLSCLYLPCTHAFLMEDHNHVSVDGVKRVQNDT